MRGDIHGEISPLNIDILQKSHAKEASPPTEETPERKPKPSMTEARSPKWWHLFSQPRELIVFTGQWAAPSLFGEIYTPIESAHVRHGDQKEPVEY